MHGVILLTRFCKLLTRVATLSGGRVPQVPQWHDASEFGYACMCQTLSERTNTSDVNPVYTILQV